MIDLLMWIGCIIIVSGYLMAGYLIKPSEVLKMFARKINPYPPKGSTGTTSTQVPLGGSPGVVSVRHRGEMKEFLATSNRIIPAKYPVKVIGVNPYNTKNKILTVEQIDT